MYRAPLRDIQFVLQELMGDRALADCAGFEDYSAELATSVLEQAARFAETVLEPLNKAGDREGAHWSAGGVVTPKGFREAYGRYVEDGWPALASNPEYGGQAVPQMLATAVQEIWSGANLAFELCPMLTHGAAHALTLTGSAAQRDLYLPKLVSGEWTGTMVLTEPQAGSDLGLIRTRAVPEDDHYRLHGQKIFITWGEHDYTPNIVHMVLARIEGAPEGTRGISLFIVPKILLNPDGSLGERNDVRCVSIEQKLGLHASPTCTMVFGEKDGAVGYLVGEPNRGLEYMFIMMNTARLGVGLQGCAMSERALQEALEWARNRVQGKPPAGPDAAATIVHHPDVKRMLLSMKSGVETMRALVLYAAHQLDLAGHHRDPDARRTAQTRADLLIPIVKAWCTELAVEVTSTGIQVHGGMGYIEEAGAAQLLRDVRITSIYEGTTGIQANDLVGRKIGRDGGAALDALIAQAEEELSGLETENSTVRAVRAAALEGLGLLRSATRTLVSLLGSDPARAGAVAVPYLMLCGFSLGGWLMTRAARIAASHLDGADRDFYLAKLQSARFYAEQRLPNALALERIVERGSQIVVEAQTRLL